MKKNYRHGDVSLHVIDELPKGLLEIKHDGKYTLALGEHTGHRHVLTETAPQTISLFKDAEGNVYIEIKKDATISHEEHKTITIKKGLYVQRHEREMDYFLGSISRVQD